MLIGVGGLTAMEPPEIGAARATIISKYGAPVGTSKAGTREVLNYREGRIILENGVVKRFEPMTPSPTPAPAMRAPEANSMSASRSTTVIRPSNGGWLSDLDEAQAQAAAQNKPILFLCTADMSSCPTGARFNEVIGSTSEFSRTMSSQFVLFRFHLNEQADTYEIGSPEFKKMWKVMTLRREVIASNFVPAMVILSPDGKYSVEADLSEPLSKGGYNDMIGGTARAIAVAKTAPQKEIGASSLTSGKLNFVYLGVGLLAFGWVVKKKFGG